MKQVYSRMFMLALLLLFFSKSNYAQLTATITSVTNPSCNSYCNGSATVTASGGTAPYTYSWTPSSQTTATATNLCAGTYTVMVIDAIPDTVTVTVTLTQPPALSVTTSANPSFCNAPNGSIYTTVAGGTPPYNYQWAPTGTPTANVFNLAPGTYWVTVTDSHNCTATASATVISAPVPSANAGSDVTVCPGGSTTLTGTAMFGSPPYTYMWSGPVFATTQQLVVTPTSTSTYTLTITDSNGCTANDVVTVYVQPLLTLSFSSSPATCSQSNGMVSVAASGGVQPYSYLWSNSSTNDTLFNQSAGVYSVTVTDAGGCTSNGQGAISNANGPSVTMTSVTQPACYLSTNGTATASVTGNGPFNYAWNTTPVQTSATVTGLPAGNYFCTVTDVNNCVTTAPLTLAQPPQLYLGAQQAGPANCTTGGTAIAWAGGGVPPYSFSWSNSMTGDTITGLAPGTYSVTVSDNSGCTSTGSVIVPQMMATLVEGRVYADYNNDCVFNNTDLPVPNQYVLIQPGGYWATTDANGNYHAWVYNTGAYTVMSYYNWFSPYTTTLCPANLQYSININSLCDTIANMDFAAGQSASVQDMRVSLTAGVARPGFMQGVYLNYVNVGTLPVSNVVLTLAYDSILGYVNAAPSPSVNQQAYLEWNIGTVQPGQTGAVNVTLQVPTLANGGYIGRQLHYLASVLPIAGDTMPADNTMPSMRIITGAYDPNEKIAASATMDSLGRIAPSDSVLAYTIFFQNTGSDTAFNIVVEDTLSPYLYPGSVVPGGSSHPYTFDMSGNGLMRFTFHNIMLPDSNVNEPASHGYVNYTVKTRANLPAGTTIENTAYIYFDFNPAIVTNTTSDMIWVNVTTGVMTNGAAPVSLYPNPTSGMLNIETTSKAMTVEVFNAIGEVVTYQQVNAGTTKVDLSGKENGVYFVKVTTAEGSVMKKVVLQR